MVLNQMKSLGKALIRRTLPERLQNKILLRRIRKDLRSYVSRTVHHTYGGIPLQVRIEDRVAEDWYDHDWPRLTELEVLARSRLNRGARVLDVGAHQGVVAMMIAHAVGKEGKVLAIEANPHNARVASENFQLNGLSQAQVLHCAVSDRPCKITMNEDPNGQIDETGDLGKIEVDAQTIDDIAKKHGVPDVLFLDVEGFELQCLKGATHTLATKPDCFIEVHVGTGLEKFGGSVTEVLKYFPKDRYRVLIAPPTDEKAFIALDPEHPSADAQRIMRQRFHLVAQAR